MQLEGISVLFSFIGGLGMFLYGMHVMANGLQHFAGGKMQRLMSFLTQNRLMAILVGTLVTAVIQSSSATTVMVVGFVNAGMLNLSQAVGVIMGANIGIPERVRQFFEPGILCAPAAGNRRICHFICKIRQKETDR